MSLGSTNQDEPPERPIFRVSESPRPTDPSLSARLGHLRFPGRKPIETPHYVALSSRGTVPHITPDIMASETDISAVYAGYEDYAERLPSFPPFITHYASAHKALSTSSPSHSHILPPSSPVSSPLRTFIALPPAPLLILGPRRHPCVRTQRNKESTATSLDVCTSQGFRRLEVQHYIAAARAAGADVCLPAVDVVLGVTGGKQGATSTSAAVRDDDDGGGALRVPGIRRRDRMVEKSTAWVKGFLAADATEKKAAGKGSVWAPILPLDAEVQRSYLDLLEDTAEDETEENGGTGGKIGGVVLYENASVDAIPANMARLPRLALTDPRTPAEALDAVGLGVDLAALPFVNRLSEAGIAFMFEFPAPRGHRRKDDGRTGGGSGEAEEKKKALGIDMWSAAYAQDAGPLVAGCACYACRAHVRAYVRHLLQAKEMLAWVLLQVHNHRALDRFFEGVRASLAAGTFAADVREWKAAYERDWPEMPAGLGPRIRGYQSISTGPGQPKINKAPYERLEKKLGLPGGNNDRKQKLAEAAESKPLDAAAAAVDLEEIGFAQLYE